MKWGDDSRRQWDVNLTEEEKTERMAFYRKNGYHDFPKREGWLERAKIEIEKMGYLGDYESYEEHNYYKKWHVMLSLEDFEELTNDEIDDLVYNYKGKKHLWELGTKDDEFDGKYKYNK